MKAIMSIICIKLIMVIREIRDKMAIIYKMDIMDIIT